MDLTIKKKIEYFLNCVDNGFVELIVELYDTQFECVRIIDEGGFVKIDRNQMVEFWTNLSPQINQPIIDKKETLHVKNTIIHHTEIIGDLGIAVLTRIKNIGNGWEPMFYNLILKKRNDEWKLLREFVHQKSMPRW